MQGKGLIQNCAPVFCEVVGGKVLCLFVKREGGVDILSGVTAKGFCFYVKAAAVRDMFYATEGETQFDAVLRMCCAAVSVGITLICDGQVCAKRRTVLEGFI